MEYFDYKIYMQKSDSFEYIVQRRRVQQYERTIYDCFLCKSYSHSSLQSIYEHFQEHEHKKNQRKYRHRYGLSGTAIDISTIFSIFIVLKII